MKSPVKILFLICPVIAHAQKGNELLVYSVKGVVMATYKNEESAVKIGKVLLPGTVIKTEKDASMTMLCREGKPLQLAKPGSFPLSHWNDSCRMGNTSLLSNYFKYIWDQFYTYSPEYRDAERKRNKLAVSRGDNPFPPKNSPKGKIRIEFSKGMDTVNYAEKSFPLSWNCPGYRGKYFFALYDASGNKLLYADSLSENYIPIRRFSILLEAGKNYRWMVATPRNAGSRKRLLCCITQGPVDQYIENQHLPAGIEEDSASRFFRFAYLLEKKHYLGDALDYYQRAAQAAPEIEPYRDQFARFRNEFWIR